VFVQIVDGEIEKCGPGSLWVMEYLQPTGIGDPPVNHDRKRQHLSV
jgi:hypothetical protein